MKEGEIVRKTIRKNLILSIFFVMLFAPFAWGMGGNDLLSGDLKAQFLFLSKQVNPRSGVNPSQSLVYNNRGIVPDDGGNLYLSGSLQTQFYPWEIFLEPLITVNQKTTALLHEGYLGYRGSSLHVEIGKKSLWWGPGVYGSLLLSKNAEPLTLIRVHHPDLFLLPGFLRVIGPLQFDFFVSRLEEDRVIPQPYFQGTRIVLKPHSIVDVGLTRTIIMGGEGKPSITPLRYWDIWFGENKDAGLDSSNSVAGLDIQLTFPSVRFYGEWGGEDEAGFFPSKGAYIVGAYFPGLFQNYFRVEYADITDPSWYVHSVYQSGYTYKKQILGHHVGRGGSDLYFEQGIVSHENKRGKITFDYQERGVNIQPVVERHYQVGTTWEFEINKAIIPGRIKATLVYERIQNEAYQTGLDKENALVAFSFIVQR